ncbi:MAG TPA: transporter substrate-binding domain-containing protein, partial [Pseudomonadales bacterium]|nr:transporter substrate-binding domain-containing protein [Pseudomonadales bacterium]
MALATLALAEEPVLRVGTSGDYPPFSRAGEGFDVDVAKRLARDLGMRIEWVPFRWPELERRLRAGDFDVVMSGVTWRPERD